MIVDVMCHLNWKMSAWLADDCYSGVSRRMPLKEVSM